VCLERIPFAFYSSLHLVFDAGIEPQKSVLIHARRPELLSTAGHRPGQLLHLTGVNGSCSERAVRCLVVGYLVPVIYRLLVRECAAGPHPPAADSDSDVSIRGDVDLLAQTGFGGSLQMSLHPLRRPLPPVDARSLYVLRHGRFGPQPRLHTLDERYHQPSVPHHQLTHLARQITVDDLHVRLVLFSFVVLRNENDHAILDEQIAELTLCSVAVPHAQNLGSSCGLAAGDMHQRQQLTAEIVYRLHPIPQLGLVDAVRRLFAHESSPILGPILNALEQPSSSVYGPQRAGVVDETLSIAVVARVIE
jgi:hypothetical protein